MAAPQPIENPQRSYEVFEKKHYMECTTQVSILMPTKKPRGAELTLEHQRPTRRSISGGCASGSALHVMLFLKNLIRALRIFNGLRSCHGQRALLVYHYPHDTHAKG